MTRPTTSKRKLAPKRITIRDAARAIVIATDATNVIPIRPLDPSRVTHRAMRQTIERSGEDSARLLYLVFDLFNAAFFGGLLGSPMILVSATSSPRAAGDYTSKDVHGFVSRIRIAPAVGRQGMRYVLGTLLHEMVHAFQHEVLADVEKGNKGHGPRFCETANAIGTQLGFPPVAYRGRGGLERAETWPTLVPQDDDGPPPKKARKAVEPPVEPVENDGDGDAGERDARDPNELARLERERVLEYILHRAALVLENGKPKLSASFRNIARRLAAGEHHTGERDDDDGEP